MVAVSQPHLNSYCSHLRGRQYPGRVTGNYGVPGAGGMPAWGATCPVGARPHGQLQPMTPMPA